LRLPHKAATWIGQLGAVSLLAGLLGLATVGAPAAVGVLPGRWAWAPAAMIALAPVLFVLDPGAFPEDCPTLGDLARKVSRLNFGVFADAGARANGKELWDALIEIASRYSSVPPGEMRPEALLLESQRRAA
jgi:hypothetical protein